MLHDDYDYDDYDGDGDGDDDEDGDDDNDDGDGDRDDDGDDDDDDGDDDDVHDDERPSPIQLFVGHKVMQHQHILRSAACLLWPPTRMRQPSTSF